MVERASNNITIKSDSKVVCVEGSGRRKLGLEASQAPQKACLTFGEKDSDQRLPPRGLAFEGLGF